MKFHGGRTDMDNYTSDSSDSDNSNNNKIIDFAYLLLEPETIDHNLEVLIDDVKKPTLEVESMILHHNQLAFLPENIVRFSNLQVLDVSNNNLKTLPDVLEHCPLRTLIAKNNCLKNSTLPKTFTVTSTLRELNLSGNQLSSFPDQILELVNLKYLYLGGNQITSVPRNVWKLHNLHILSLGGNLLTDVPSTVGQLRNLQALVLCDNLIESLPANIANLHQLKSLLLHKNRLKTLPPEIIALKNLTELSLRENPLVVRFVTDMTYNPASLLELSARTVKVHNMNVGPSDIPFTLLNYLESAHRCVNPRCKGVFFDNRVEHIKFVDFCGKYRIPLLQYLCSSKCITGTSERVPTNSTYMMRKVLLG